LTKESRQHSGEKIVYLTSCARTTGHTHTMNLDIGIKSVTKIISKWIIDLNDEAPRG
jgi:hypothetical protein